VIGFCLNRLAWFHIRERDYTSALDCFREGEGIFRQLEDAFNTMTILRGLGFLYASMGDADAEREVIQQGIELGRSVGDRFYTAQFLFNRGWTNVMTGNATDGG
jgi:tetratricopeptide (TPR) repeat protein